VVRCDGTRNYPYLVLRDGVRGTNRRERSHSPFEALARLSLYSVLAG